MESHDEIVVGEESVNLGLDQDVRQDHYQIVGCDELIVVEGVCLRDDLDDFLKLLKLASRRLLMLDSIRFLNGQLPRMLHLILDLLFFFPLLFILVFDLAEFLEVLFRHFDLLQARDADLLLGYLGLER